MQESAYCRPHLHDYLDKIQMYKKNKFNWGVDYTNKTLMEWRFFVNGGPNNCDYFKSSNDSDSDSDNGSDRSGSSASALPPIKYSLSFQLSIDSFVT